jgi:hypothetical protein
MATTTYSNTTTTTTLSNTSSSHLLFESSHHHHNEIIISSPIDIEISNPNSTNNNNSTTTTPSLTNNNNINNKTLSTLLFSILFRRHSIVKFTLVFLILLRLVKKLWNKRQRGQRNPSVKRVAVVGGGIAGAGAAWSLRRSGFDVVLFERKPKLGGNAKSFTWQVENGAKVDTGLAVLAYPHEHFHSYIELMNQLGMKDSSLHELKYFVAEKNYRGPGTVPSDGLECVFAHGREGFKPEPWLEEDLKKWEQLASFVRRVNGFFQPCSYKSLYRNNILNPLNIIPMKKILNWWGISDWFWERVFVPVHTSTFLEVKLENIPAVLIELLDDLVPFTKVPEMRAWSSTAYQVFVEMTKGWPKDSIRTSCAVENVEFKPRSSSSSNNNKSTKDDLQYDVWITHEDTTNNDPERFDAVIFACSAPAIRQALHSPSNLNNGLGFLMSWLEDFTLRNTIYTVDRDKTFEQGIVHSEAHKVFPAKFAQDLLKHHCNYMVIDGKNPSNLENHFIISSWSPTAQNSKVPMLVSYNCEQANKEVDALWTVTARDAHPCLTFFQLIASNTIWPILQGTRSGQAWFCGSAITPGNGHDLSLLSGFVAAARLGAPYPFPGNSKGAEDYERLDNMMMGGIF